MFNDVLFWSVLIYAMVATVALGATIHQRQPKQRRDTNGRFVSFPTRPKLKR